MFRRLCCRLGNLNFKLRFVLNIILYCFKGIIHTLSKRNVDGIGCLPGYQWYPLNALSKMLKIVFVKINQFNFSLTTFIKGICGNLHKTQERKLTEFIWILERQTPISFSILHKWKFKGYRCESGIQCVQIGLL